MAKNAFGLAAHAIIEQFIYAKMPQPLKKSMNQAHLENDSYEQIVTHLERELELNVLEAPDQLQIITLSHSTANTKSDRLKPTCHFFKKLGHKEVSVCCRKDKNNRLKTLKIFMETKTVASITLSQTTIQTRKTTTTTTKTVTELKESRKLFFHPVRHVGRQTTPQGNAAMDSMQPIDRLPGTEDQKDRIRSKKEPTKATQMKLLKLQPKS